MNNEIKVNKVNKSITFINNGIAFSQFGIADEILDLITNLQETIDKATQYYLSTLAQYEKEFKKMPDEAVMMFNLLEGNK